MIDSLSALGRVSRILDKACQNSLDWSLEQVVLSPDACRSLSFLNAHAVNMVYENEAFYGFLAQSSHLLRDGIGVKIAMKLFGKVETENLNGTDLIPVILDKYKDRSLAIFGASREALNACQAKLAEQGVCNIVCTEHGFLEEQAYLELCRVHMPDIIVLCMGMPKQELLAQKIQDQNLCRLVICGGGWADFYSGIKVRAPLWIRRLSLEWLHRLWREPKRLGKRYTLGVLYFFYIVLRARLADFTDKR